MKRYEVDLNINSVVVIESLPESEPQTGTQLYNDIIRLMCYKQSLHCGIIKIASKEEFLMLPSVFLEHRKKNNLLPLLHFEIHGNDDGLSLASGDFLTWGEVAKVTRNINLIMENNLFISLATCKGAYFIKGINDPTIPAPFWGIIGPKHKIINEEVVEDFSVFYEELLTSLDLEKAIASLNKSNLRVPYIAITAEFIFDQFIEDYFKYKPLDKEAKFEKLRPKMDILYPQLSNTEKDEELRNNIAKIDRPELIKKYKSIFLLRHIS